MLKTSGNVGLLIERERSPDSPTPRRRTMLDTLKEEFNGTKAQYNHKNKPIEILAIVDSKAIIKAT
jgi:hypothetical protein